MFEILGLIMPLFGLIILGFVTARITRQPLEALGWLNESRIERSATVSVVTVFAADMRSGVP